MAISPILAQVLARYGLSSLTDWASNALVFGLSNDQIVLELYERPEFAARFPAIKAREAAGYPPISPEEYLQFEDTMYGLSKMWDLNITQDEINQMLANNVSPREGEERVTIAASLAFEEDPETVSELSRLYDVTAGQLIRYYMNPKKSLGLLQQQYRSAQIAGASIKTGFGELTQQQALLLTQAGLDKSSAVSGFTQLIQNEELFRSVVGTEQDISKEQQIGLLAGDAELGMEVETRARRRLAEYQGGGGPAAGEKGFALGSAPK